MIRTRLKEALSESTARQDEVSTATLRLIHAALKDRDVAARDRGNRDGVCDDEVIAMLQAMIKQRRESIELFRTAARDDLVAAEVAEIGVIERFLPAQLDDSAMDAAITEVFEDVEATGLKDVGRVMCALHDRYTGQMDFCRASARVKQRLTGGSASAA